METLKLCRHKRTLMLLPALNGAKSFMSKKERAGEKMLYNKRRKQRSKKTSCVAGTKMKKIDFWRS